MAQGGAAGFAWELLQVAAQERVEDPPLSAAMVFDDPRVTERAQRLVGDVGRESVVELGAERARSTIRCGRRA